MPMDQVEVELTSGAMAGKRTRTWTRNLQRRHIFYVARRQDPGSSPPSGHAMGLVSVSSFFTERPYVSSPPMGNCQWGKLPLTTPCQYNEASEASKVTELQRGP